MMSDNAPRAVSELLGSFVPRASDMFARAKPGGAHVVVGEMVRLAAEGECQPRGRLVPRCRSTRTPLPFLYHDGRQT
ncbi:hypothetical protein M3J09_004973 [Ascochyta lentis]